MLDLQRKHSAAMEELLAQTQGRLDKMEAFCSTRAGDASRAVTELESRVRQLLEKVQSLEHARAAALAQLRGAEERELAARAAVEQVAREHREIVARLRDEHAIIVGRHAQASLETQQRIKDLQGQLASVRDEAGRKERAVVEGVRQRITALEEAVKDRDAQLGELSKSYATIKQQSGQQLQKLADELQSLARQSQDGAADQRVQIDAAVESRTSTLRSKIAGLESDLSQARAEVVRLRAETAGQAEHVRAAAAREHAQAVALEEMRAQLAESRRAQTRRQDDQYVAEIERLESSRRSLQQAQAAELERAREEMRALAAAQEAELLSVRTAHSEALERTQRELIESRSELARLRDELNHAATIRKAQLSELGILRDEERQLAEARFDSERQQLLARHRQEVAELREAHGAETVQLLERINRFSAQVETESRGRTGKVAAAAGPDSRWQKRLRPCARSLRLHAGLRKSPTVNSTRLLPGPRATPTRSCGASRSSLRSLGRSSSPSRP
eukprot:m.164761 g.164761  ORF g.164761 m.164761 type:complete len:506 (+) comp9887_c0_seq23:638-2155(+)